jgi:hypothetical protein
MSSSELISLVHRTLSGDTPDSPVRQTRAAFGFFCSFGTCRAYNLEAAKETEGCPGLAPVELIGFCSTELRLPVGFNRIKDYL